MSGFLVPLAVVLLAGIPKCLWAGHWPGAVICAAGLAVTLIVLADVTRHPHDWADEPTNLDTKEIPA